ncbi:hypothetical protein OG21DRAFT_1510296 [Imleria badia]|nr:hypothetical protein OG21DRAFT_1510296 [Imleria badia]
MGCSYLHTPSSPHPLYWKCPNFPILICLCSTFGFVGLTAVLGCIHAGWWAHSCMSTFGTGCLAIGNVVITAFGMASSTSRLKPFEAEWANYVLRLSLTAAVVVGTTVHYLHQVNSMAHAVGTTDGVPRWIQDYTSWSVPTHWQEVGHRDAEGGPANNGQGTYFSIKSTSGSSDWSTQAQAMNKSNCHLSMSTSTETLV